MSKFVDVKSRFEHDIDLTDDEALAEFRRLHPILRKKKRLKWIGAHTEDELNAAVEKAAATFPDFYVLLHGIDAYMERRRRRIAKHNAKVREHVQRECMEELADPWGDS